MNINPLFRDAIEKCLQYDSKQRVGISELLKHRMFKICAGLPSDILRVKTTSKSQPRKSLPIYNKTKKLKVNRIVRPPNKNLVNPYVSAFSKPLGGGYILANNGRRSGRYDFLLGK